MGWVVDDGGVPVEGGRIRTVDDLPPPIGNTYTAPLDAFIEGVPNPPFPNTLFIPAGFELVVPQWGTLRTAGYRTARVQGSHPTGLVRLDGGSIRLLEVVNDFGGVAADIHHTSGFDSLVRDVNCFGAGVGICCASTAPGSFLLIDGGNCTNNNGMTRGIVYANGGNYGGVSIINSFITNATGADGFVCIDFEAGSNLGNGIDVRSCFLVGGFSTNCIGIRGGTAAFFFQSITLCKIIGFDDPSSELVSGTITPDFARSTNTANLPSSVDTKPLGVYGFESAGVPPETDALLINTWYPINATGGSLLPSSSLYLSPASGEIQNQYFFEYKATILGLVAIEKTGTSVAVKFRITSSNDGIVWTQVGSISAGQIKEATTVAIEADVKISDATRFRLELSSDTVVTFRTISYLIKASG